MLFAAPVLARTVLFVAAEVLLLAAADVLAAAEAVEVLLAAPLLLAAPPLLPPWAPPLPPLKAAAAKASPANKGAMRMRDVKAVENFMALYVGKDCIENEEGFTEVNGPDGIGS